MTDSLRPALAAYLATHRVKLVHVWQTLGRWNAMMEWPYDPTARKPLVTEKHVTGVGSTREAAVLAGLQDMGHGALLTRLWLLTRVIG